MCIFVTDCNYKFAEIEAKIRLFQYFEFMSGLFLFCLKEGFNAQNLSTVEKRTDSCRILATFEFRKCKYFAAFTMPKHSSDRNFRTFWAFIDFLQMFKVGIFAS